MLKSKKGFTLIELLAVIVVLAIIGVIAGKNVSDVLERSIENSFKSSYDAIHKDVKNRIEQKKLGLNVVLECDDNDPDVNKHCSKIYEISEEDYKMKVEKVNDTYSLCVQGIGKFEDIDLNGSKAMYTIFENRSYNKINVKNIEQCNFLSKIENISVVPENTQYKEYIEYVGQKTANHLYETAEKLVPGIVNSLEKCISESSTYGEKVECKNKYKVNTVLEKSLEENNLPGKIRSVTIDEGEIEITLAILEGANKKIEQCQATDNYKGCSLIIEQLQHKDLFCYFVSASGELFADIVMKKDKNENYQYVKEDRNTCLGRN